MTEANEWFAQLRACGRKENSIHNYEKNLYSVFRCLIADGRSYKAEDITTDDILYLYNNLKVKEETARGYLRTLAGLCIHQTGRDVVKQTSILFNRENRTRNFVKPEDFAKMYRIASPMGRMVLMLGGLMGLRREEMTRIRDEDIRGSMMRIHGKGHGQNGMVTVVQIPGPVMKEIESYRKFKEKLPTSGDGYLLQNINPRERKLSKCGVSSISNLVAKLAREAGVEATCHGLRRMFATTLYYKVQCDPASLKALLRHSSISTTFKCYIDAYDLEQRQAVDRLTDYMSELLEEAPAARCRPPRL